MNRKQRRAHSHIEQVDLRNVLMPQQMSQEECRSVALYRLGLNLGETGHPFHHKTASGVIVDVDPTLEYFLSRLDEADAQHFRAYYGSQVSPNAAKAVPVNRRYYGRDLYEVN